MTDTSSNGTYLNEETAPISDIGSQALKDGDRLRIGDYEVIVSVDAANDFSPEKSAIVAYEASAHPPPASRPRTTSANH